MNLNAYYGGHSISDKGIVKLKLKTDYTQQEECGALYATLQANVYRLIVDGENCGSFTIDSIKIDKNFDTTITLKGYYSDAFFPTLYGKIKATSEEEMTEIVIERGED